MSDTLKKHRSGRPRGDEARKLAEKYGPADSTLLRQLAAHARYEADYGGMTHGHVIAERLELLAREVNITDLFRAAATEKE